MKLYVFEDVTNGEIRFSRVEPSTHIRLGFVPLGSFEITPEKRMVKKWKWVIRNNTDPTKFGIYETHSSEQEAIKWLEPAWSPIQKINASEIEVGE